MNSSVPPPDGAGGTPQIVQQTTVIQMDGRKNVGLAILLAFLFGPLGMLYATIPGAIIMFFVNIVVAVLTLGLGLFITIPIGVLWAGLAANSHNTRLQAVTAQTTVGQPAAAAVAPAAWHDDPDGSGRLRFYNGTRWTDHYADKPGQASAEPTQPDAPTKQLPPPAEEPETVANDGGEGGEEVTVVLKSTAPTRAACGSCGHEIDPRAKFCSGCGAAQTPV